MQHVDLRRELQQEKKMSGDVLISRKDEKPGNGDRPAMAKKRINAVNYCGLLQGQMGIASFLRQFRLMDKRMLRGKRTRQAHHVGAVGLALTMLWGTPCGAFAQDDSNFDIAGLQAIRGVVSRVSGSSVFLKTQNGTLYQVETGPNTHFVRKGEAATGNTAHPGDTVLAGGELDAKKHTLGAVFVAVVNPEELAELDQRRGQWGKTWLAGTVTAKNGTSLVVKRPDGVIDTVTVDEDTSFRKKHQSITLPDVQVGDGMTATGVQGKAGFAAKVLTVVDAAEIREWSRLNDQKEQKD
jgi:hypothetical protein